MHLVGSPIFPGGFMPHGHCYMWAPSLIAPRLPSGSLISFSRLFVPIAPFPVRYSQVMNQPPSVPASRARNSR